VTVRELTKRFGATTALAGMTWSARHEQVTAVLGPNGAGKTTLLRAISGLVKVEEGSTIRLNGKETVGYPPYRIVREGIAHVPEGRQVFPAMSVNENLEVATIRIPRERRKERIDSVYQLFSELAPRKNQQAGSLSGGEQQMLAIGRAVASDCQMVLIDEPSMGLAPIIVQRIFRTLKDIVRETKLTLLIVEQNAKLSLPLSDRIYVLSQGSIVMEGPVAEIHNNQMIQDMYFAKG
jgi:branched-chain amino acid transport system ATP-binding protein